MKETGQYVVDLFKVFVYYLLLFAVCRITFLLYFSHEIVPDGAGLLPQSLWKALPLDISTACYLLGLPLTILFIRSFTSYRFMTMLTRWYILLTSFIIIFLSISEIGVYREIHVKLYFNLLTHVLHPGELFRTTSFGLMFTILLLTGVILLLSIMFLNKLLPSKTRVEKISWKGAFMNLIAFIICGVLLAIFCRGGLQPIPINEGGVYFSRNQCVNDATVNPLWNIVHSFIENKLVLRGDAYKQMSDEQAQKICTDLFAVQRDTTTELFKVRRPNICIIILEGWAADVIYSLGGYQGLTPNFENLIHDGYLFSNIKPAGHVSDQGVPAILSGYPALPIGSAINQPERQVHLPCINTELKSAGYCSSFFFGGQLIYGNIKAYVYRNEFDEVIEQKDLPSLLPVGRLGIGDSLMLDIWGDSLRLMKPPFFSCLFTSSTHSPFDTPSSNTIDWGGSDQPYLNSVAYADRQLGRFFDNAKKQGWYDSTIFIIVSDHSHGTPKNYDYSSPEFYHIPLLITGGALRDEYRGVKDDRLGSQTDIASTLLHQLTLPSEDYRWSKDLLNPYTQRFAFYAFDEGFGFMEGKESVVWNKKYPPRDAQGKAIEVPRDSNFMKGAAYLQILMQDFLSK